MTREQEIVKHLDALIELAGFDKSESATEAFVELLDDAVTRARIEIHASHLDGLSLDSRWIIADVIAKGEIPATA